MTTLGPITLEGRHVRLEPLRPHHLDGLAAAGADPTIFTWTVSRPKSRDDFANTITRAMAAEERGEEYAFAVVLRESGRIVGSTRYMEVRPAHRGAEIGSTWYARDVWQSQVNPECKLLLLQHAFEDWGALRVQLKTDHMNERSQAAIRKLGAVYEGTLRNHLIRADGTVRHTVYFSITPEEWPAVKAGLLKRI